MMYDKSLYYEKNVYVDRAEDIAARAVYDENGLAKVEMLPGVYKDGIVNYKYFLKAGCTCEPEVFTDKTVLLMFGKGEGELIDKDGIHRITEVAFYVPSLDGAKFTVRALADMEFTYSVIEMNKSDMDCYDRWHIALPYFRLYGDCTKYIQDCKGPNTESRMILCQKWVGRIMVGTTRAFGEGTVEKGHPKVHQFNYCLGYSDFDMSVGYKDKNEMETIPSHAGDWSFIPGGPDHDLVAKPGKEVYYIWFEHFTDPEQMAKL